MKKNEKDLNNHLRKCFRDDKIEIGVDEVGRGPLFGRVYSGAVILPKTDDFDFSLMKDSKKFTNKKKLIEVANYIKEKSIIYSISYIDEKTIDNINIKNSSLNAMHNAIKNIVNNELYCNLKNDILLLIDGNTFKPYTYLDNNQINYIEYINIEGGDNKYCSIAAASIIAKVEHDEYIEKLCLEYPRLHECYDLKNNKGYGTPKHIEGIKKYGISPWHRISYSPCKNININDYNYYK